MNGKGSKNRSNHQKYREGWEFVFGDKPHVDAPFSQNYSPPCPLCKDAGYVYMPATKHRLICHLCRTEAFL